MEYIINGNNLRAEYLWDKYLVNCSLIKYKRLFQYAFENKKPEHMQYVVDHLKQNKNVSLEALGNAYSRLIHFYLSIEDLGAARACVDKAFADGLTAKQITMTTWRAFKKLCAEKNEEFNYNLSDNNVKGKDN